MVGGTIMSNKIYEIMRRRFENNAKLYEYKIVSNCIGGG